MPKIVKLDLDTYRRTDLSGCPVHIFIEEEIPDLGMVTDSDGNPTKGGIIGYALAYCVLAAFLVYFFYFIP